MKIESLEEWRKIEIELTSEGRRIWQMQYDTSHPEGFHARFCATGKPDIEVVTHSNKVYTAIMAWIRNCEN